MWLDLPKGILYAHNFKSHFSLPFDRYNNRLTVHACTIAKDSTVYFYWGLIHRPVWHPPVLRWSVNSSNLPARQTAGKESPQDWLVWLGIDVTTFCDMWSWKKPGLMSFGCINLLALEGPATSLLPTTPYPWPIGLHMVSTTLWNKLSKMVGISTSFPLKSPSTEWSWMTID